MKAIQYTIRNIPVPIDRYLRKRAKISGQSLNHVIIEELSDRAGLLSNNLIDSLDWMIGANVIDNGVIQALNEEDKIQKNLTKKQWQAEDDN
jgi:hypothetical protein